MSARINGITNTNNDVVIENNMKELPLVREEYYLTRESFNKFIANDISFGSNISISGDLIPLNSVTSDLGSSTKYWSNAYIRDVSVSNMSISGNINVSENINITENINISGNINVSENINISGNLLSLSNTSQIGSSENYWSNAYIRDVSINNISISGNNSVGGNISISGNNSVGGNISISGDIIPLNNAISDLGSNEKYWRNAYMRDLSVTNISVSGSIIIPNGSILTNDISNLNITHEKIANNAIQTHNIDNSAITHAKIANNAIQAHNIANNAITHVKIADNAIQAHNIDASAVINSKIAYGTITSDKINSSGTWSFTNISISGDLIPLNSVASDLGSSTNYWSNAYIHDISASNISVSGNINVDKNISISGDLEPLYSVRSDLGSSTKYWRNAYIDNIDISSHIRIGNGHFGGKITATTTQHELIIDPYSFENSPYTGNDASGRVVILGDLIVRGDTTTINSATIDISDLLLNIASSATKNTVFGIESGIKLGSDSYASLLYNKDSNSWRTNIGIEISGNITLSGNLISSSKTSLLGSSANYWNDAYITNLNVTNFVNTIDASYLTDNTITSAKIATGTIVNNDISNNASIAFSKINASLAIADSDISSNAAIVYSKLNLVNTIVNNDIASNADISGSKLANASIASSKIDSTGTWTFTNISGTHMSISGNLVPLYVTNTSTLGSTTNYWRNAYIQDLSVNNTISISGNLEPLNTNNTSRLGNIGKLWSNAYITDLSVANITVSGTITIPAGSITSSHIADFTIVNNDIATNADISGSKIANASIASSKIDSTGTWTFTNISGTHMSISGNLVPLYVTNTSTLGSTTNYWRNAYIANIDVSGDISNVTRIIPQLRNDISSSLGTIQNIWQKAFISDLSGITKINGTSWPLNSGSSDFSGTDISTSLIPRNSTSIDLGSIAKYWGNAYIRDISVTNIEISGNLLPLRDISSDLGSSLKRWRNIYVNDLSVARINGQAYSAATAIDLTSVSGNIIPSLNNNFRLGDVSRNWGNAYIRDISVTNIEISGNLLPLHDISSDLGSSLKRWRNIYVNDLSVARINGQAYSAATAIDLTSVSGNIIPSLNNNFRLGDVSRNWGNAYIRDLSVANITVSGTITIPTGSIISSHIADGTIMNLDISSNADISGSKIANASIASSKIDSTGTWTFTNISGTHMSISGNLVPLYVTNTSTLGSTTNYWRNAYIRDLSVNNTMSISGNLEPLASNNTSKLGSTSKLWSNAYIRDLSVANITVSGNMLSQNNTSQVPVSYSTFSVVSAQNRTLPAYIGTQSANEWIPASTYDISKVVLSNRSVIKIEVKVNYTASPEADQTLSFRVRESSNNGLSYIPTPVFSDISLGSSMGVTINNIYNGSYYDDLSGITLSGNIITYRLEFRRDCPSGNTIKTDYGIQASTGNYISLQELYKPP